MESARGTVLIVHGLGEHIGRYEALTARLNRWGWHVVGHDQRGHGASGGPRGDIPAQDSLLKDLALVIDEVRGDAQLGAGRWCCWVTAWAAWWRRVSWRAACRSAMAA